MEVCKSDMYDQLRNRMATLRGCVRSLAAQDREGKPGQEPLCNTHGTAAWSLLTPRFTQIRDGDTEAEGSIPDFSKSGSGIGGGHPPAIS
jgi:hypothetical protein